MTSTMRKILEEIWRLLVDLRQDDANGLADQVGAILDGRIHECEIGLIVGECVRHATSAIANVVRGRTDDWSRFVQSKAAQLDALVFAVRSLLAEQQMARDSQRMVAALTEGLN